MAMMPDELTTPPPTQAALIASLRREIEDLRALAQKPEKPWYRDGALLVALAAFIFTLVTWRQQDLHDTRLQLDNVLKELYAMPEANAEALAKFHNSPVGFQISQGINARNEVLSRQAYELADHLGHHLESVERTAVASAIGMAAPGLAEKLLEAGSFSQGDPETYMAAQRQLGALAIHAGATAKGDQHFQAAENLVQTIGTTMDSEDRQASNGLTEMEWGEAYLSISRCAAAQTHFKAAQGLIANLVPQERDMMESQLMGDLQFYAHRCGAAG